MADQEKNSAVRKAKDRYITKIYWLCFNMVFIFLIPALIMLYVGKEFQNHYNHERNFVPIFLLASFVFSWIIVFYYYRYFVRKTKEVDQGISEV